MQTFIDNLYLFCQFFIRVCGDVASFLIGNPLGLLIIGLSLFGVIIGVIITVFNIVHK